MMKWTCVILIFLSSTLASSATEILNRPMSLSEASARLAKFGSGEYVIIASIEAARSICNQGLWSWRRWWSCDVELNNLIFSKPVLSFAIRHVERDSSFDPRNFLLKMANRYVDPKTVQSLEPIKDPAIFLELAQ